MKLFRYIWPYFLPLKAKLILTAIYFLIASVFSLVSISLIIPFFYFIIDSTELTPQGNIFIDSLVQFMAHSLSNISVQHALLFICIAFVILISLRNATVYLSSKSLLSIRVSISNSIRNNLFSKLIHIRLADTVHLARGSESNRIVGMVQEFESSVYAIIEFLLKHLIQLIIFISFLFTIHVGMTLLILTVLIPLLLVVFFFSAQLKRHSFKGFKGIADLNNAVIEFLSNIKVIKAFRFERQVKLSFEEANNNFTKAHFTYLIQRMKIPLVTEVIFLVFLLSMFYWSAITFLNEGNQQLHYMIAYLLLCTQLVAPLKALSNFLLSYHRAKDVLDRMLIVFDAAGYESVLKDENSDYSLLKKDICIQNLSFRYKEDWVLKNVNLSIPAGSKVGWLGENGTGKTTMADILMLFHDNYSGSVLYDGISLHQMTPERVRDKIVYIGQQDYFFNGTLSYNLRIANMNASDDDIVKASKATGLHQHVQKFALQYDENIGEGGCRLSGGQKKLLSITRAFLKDPDLIICDEITASLDVFTEVNILKVLNKVFADKTIIYISHHLHVLQYLNLIMVFQDQHIVQQGNHEELMKNTEGVYYKLYNLKLNS